MRFFVAADLPEELREALAETLAFLRASVRGRFVKPDQLHMTLAFLGEAESARIDDLVRTLDEACAPHAAFPIELGELGSFGKRNRATLWQGVSSGGSSALVDLAHDVRTALSESGFSYDEKKFLPHVTIMRNADLSSGALGMPVRASGTLNTVTLYRSELASEGATYQALYRVRLPRDDAGSGNDAAGKYANS